MAGNGDDSAAVTFVGGEAMIEQADVAIAVDAKAIGADGGFDISPLEIAVDVAAGAAVTGVTSGRA